MKILQLTKKFPYPIKDGEVIGIINLTLGFSELGHEVTTLSLNTNKHYFDLEKLPEKISKSARFIPIDIDTTINPLKAFLNLFSKTSYNIDRFYSKKYINALKDLIKTERYDFVLMEGVYLMQYVDIIRNNSSIPIVFRPQNVEYIIWERLRDQTTNPLKKWYLNLLASRMKKFETEVMNKANLMVTVSQTDLDIFARLGLQMPGVAIPTGYMFNDLPDIIDTEENAVGFIGGMDWMPNREGVEWFVKEVWPLIVKEIPNAQFYLAGRNFPDDIKKWNFEGVNVIGEVDDAVEFVKSKSISICPLFAGSGMRVKIVEAMALGRAIVSTSVGAESLLYTNGKDILIGDSVTEFSSAIIKVLKNNELRLTIGKNAQKLIRNSYDNREICKKIIDFVKEKI